MDFVDNSKDGEEYETLHKLLPDNLVKIHYKFIKVHSIVAIYKNYSDSHGYYIVEFKFLLYTLK